MINQLPEEVKMKIENLENQIDSMAEELLKLDKECEQITNKAQSYKYIIFALGAFVITAIIFLSYGYSKGFPMDSTADKLKQEQIRYSLLEKQNQNLSETVSQLTQSNMSDGGYNTPSTSSYTDSFSEETNNTANTGGIIYRVQIGAFENYKTSLYSENILGLKIFKESPYVKYSIGAVKTKKEADLIKETLSKMGIQGSVIAEYNGKKINISEAYKYEK